MDSTQQGLLQLVEKLLEKTSQDQTVQQLQILNDRMLQMMEAQKIQQHAVAQTEILNQKLDQLTSAIARQTDMTNLLLQQHQRQAGHQETVARELVLVHQQLSTVVSQGANGSQQVKICSSLQELIQKSQEQIEVMNKTQEWFQNNMSWTEFYTQIASEKLQNVEYRQCQTQSMPSDANRMVDLEARGEKMGNPASSYVTYGQELLQGKFGMGQLVQKPSQWAWLPVPLDSPFSVN